MGRGVKMGGGLLGKSLDIGSGDFTENPKSFFQSEVLLAGSTSSWNECLSKKYLSKKQRFRV